MLGILGQRFRYGGGGLSQSCPLLGLILSCFALLALRFPLPATLPTLQCKPYLCQWLADWVQHQ